MIEIDNHLHFSASLFFPFFSILQYLVDLLLLPRTIFDMNYLVQSHHRHRIFFVCFAAPDFLMDIKAYVTADSDADVPEHQYKILHPSAIINDPSVTIQVLFPKFFDEFDSLAAHQQYRLLIEAILLLRNFAEIDRKYNTFLFYPPFSVSLLCEPTIYTQRFAVWLRHRLDSASPAPTSDHFIDLLDICNPTNADPPLPWTQLGLTDPVLVAEVTKLALDDNVAGSMSSCLIASSSFAPLI